VPTRATRGGESAGTSSTGSPGVPSAPGAEVRLEPSENDVEEGRRRPGRGGVAKLALVVRVLRRFLAINGYDRALALSAQAFIGVVPVLVALSAFSPHSIRTSAGNAVVAGLGLSGDAATTISTLIERPPAVQPLTIAGCALLVLSVLGFTRALQRTYLSAWELPATGIRGLGHGFLAAAVLIGGFAALVLLWPVFALFDGHIVIELIVNAVGATLLWWPIQRVLLDGRVGWWPLLPGAALNGCGQAVVLGLSAIYLPSAISRSSQKYGLVGAAVPLISWLVVVGSLLVLSAVLGAELVRPAHPSPAATTQQGTAARSSSSSDRGAAEAPSRPGHAPGPVNADRLSGDDAG
jgi:membrane protein